MTTAYKRGVTVFLCARCGIKLTWDLVELPAMPPVDPDERDDRTRLAASTIPRGDYAIEAEPWGAPYVPHPDQRGSQPAQPRGQMMIIDGVWVTSAGPRGNIVVHPEDAADLRPLLGSSLGCCGPSGRYGLNLACPCGAKVATIAADCLGPYELHLDAKRTFATAWF